jgi:sugar lactone lactonase YvrE
VNSPEVLLDGLCFPEGPRWHQERLWFSDMHAHKVLALDVSGAVEVMAQVPNQPSGLGWLPDGRLLVVSMTDRRLLRQEPGGHLVEHADLSALAPFHCNDMVVAADGTAYVGNFGFDLHAGEPPRATTLLMVTPDGRASVAADELRFPNGMVITPDGGTLIVGESFGARLTAFDRSADGRLTNRRVWAALEGAVPDGIALDAEGGIWVASPVGSQVLRVCEGGEVSHRIAVETQAFACMLGGPARRTLFILTAEHSDPVRAAASRSGRIETVAVDYPGAGWP